MKSIKRFVYLLHRWIGVVFSLLILLWFASGIVMMYVEFPTLTPPERFAHTPALDISRVVVAPDQALALQGVEPGTVDYLRLTTVLGQPAYVIKDLDGQWRAVFAEDGSLVTDISPAQAEKAAAAFVGNGVSATHLAELQFDQWSVSGNLNSHRPLHKVAVSDGRGSILYVSSRTGEVVRDTSAFERGWNWVGAIVHWVYPAVLRQHPKTWSNVVIYLSLGGLIAIFTGIIVGIWRVRLRRRYRSGGISPYRGWQLWHHIGGLVCAVFFITFMFSGLMSMNPWGVFDNHGETAREQVARFTGGPLDISRFNTDIFAAAALLPDGFDAREVHWHQHVEDAHLIFVSGTGTRVAVDVTQGRTPTTVTNMGQRVARQAPLLLPSAMIDQQTVLNEYDSYYYTTHQRYRPLPMMRVKFDDEAHTWFHIDPVTGEVLSRSTSTDRVKRWLYNGLHSLDFRFLMAHRPLWDIVVVTLSLLGVGLSVTSVVIGWRRLQLKLGRF